MKNFIRIAVAAGLVASAKPDARADVAIRDVLQKYETALNTKDLETVLSLYGSEPVFMPQNSSALTGREAVRAGYSSPSASRFTTSSRQATGPGRARARQAARASSRRGPR